MNTNPMRFVKKMVFLVLCMPLLALASGGEMALDKAPVNLHDHASLQRGAQIFVNYCLSCHSASYMRYNRLQDLGLSEQQIKDNLLLAGSKVGDTMSSAMDKKDAKEWFGVAPPDLSVIARSRGADWLYTYLRAFYRDGTTPTGWNNLVYDKVAMPHALYQLQGIPVLKVEKVASKGEALKMLRTGGQVGKMEELHEAKPAAGSHEGSPYQVHKISLDKPGQLTTPQYNAYVGDLVNYLVYMGEPAKTKRIQLGIIVMFFLSIMFVIAYLLKKEYWKDVH